MSVLAPLKQHLIDPEICIRCNTCEETCTIGAITHDSNNYVVDATKCNFCMDCVGPCPTGAINNFIHVSSHYSLEDQFGWLELPKPEPDEPAGDRAVDAFEDEAAALLAEAHAGAGGKVRAPASASRPQVNLFNRANPLRATVVGNYRITDQNAESDVRHIILDCGTTPFPVLEGQSVGIVPPGLDSNGRPHAMRLYSIASPRDGEKPNSNNFALTVKRVAEHRADGSIFRGLASNYLCDLNKGNRIGVVGPFGATFLMPDDQAADIIMVCTGTGSAPFRGFTERRRRTGASASGKLYLFFGARAPQELPYFGPLKKVPPSLLDQELVYSRLPGREKEYVQHRMMQRAGDLAAILRRESAHLYVCGLKGMEAGVELALMSICDSHGLDWPAIRRRMQDDGRFHVETY